MSIVRINEFRAAPAKSGALHEFLSAVIAVIEGSPGCLGCDLLIDQEDDAHLVIVESWQDVAAHQAAARRIPPAELARIQPLLAAPPTGRYYHKA
jgi:quinol monooxygenase YgiN